MEISPRLVDSLSLTPARHTDNPPSCQVAQPTVVVPSPSAPRRQRRRSVSYLISGGSVEFRHIRVDLAMRFAITVDRSIDRDRDSDSEEGVSVSVRSQTQTKTQTPDTDPNLLDRSIGS